MEREKEQWINKALNSLEGMEPAVPAAGIHGRIMERIQAERLRIREVVSMTTITRAAAAVFLILAVNVFTCITFSKNITHQKQLQSFAKTYSLTDTDDSFLN